MCWWFGVGPMEVVAVGAGLVQVQLDEVGVLKVRDRVSGQVLPVIPDVLMMVTRGCGRLLPGVTPGC